MSGAHSARVPITTPRTPNSAARLQEEERKMMMRGKELLASDQLTQLAGRESRTLDGARRTSEALSWLDRRLDADLRASRADAPGAVPEEGETPDASRAETEAAMRSIVPSRSKAELLREKIERRGAMDAGVEVKSSEYARSGQSYLSENARARLDRIKEGHQVWQDQTPAGSGVAREDSRQPELWADQAHRQRSSLVHVRPFPDLSATSKAARESAAPHIASIYDQIFVDQIEDTCGQPDTEPVVDRFQDCTLVLDEAWDAVEGANDNVGGDMVGRRSHYERRLTQSIAESLGVPLHRVKVNEMHPGPSWYRVNELIVDLTMLPDAAGHPPTCKSLCEDLRAQAKAPGSQLRSRIPAVRVELPSEDLPYRAPDQTSRLTFSLLRGGIVEERPQEHKSAAHAARGGDSALLARDHVTSAPQHVQYMVQQVLPAAQRNDEGFWLRVEDSKPPTLPKGMYTARYGTMQDAVAGTPRLSRQWRVWAAGLAVMLILAGWVLYMRADELGL